MFRVGSIPTTRAIFIFMDRKQEIIKLIKGYKSKQTLSWKIYWFFKIKYLKYKFRIQDYLRK